MIPRTETVIFFEASGWIPLEAMHSQSPEASFVREGMWRWFPWIVIPDENKN